MSGIGNESGIVVSHCDMATMLREIMSLKVEMTGNRAILDSIVKCINEQKPVSTPFGRSQSVESLSSFTSYSNNTSGSNVTKLDDYGHLIDTIDSQWRENFSAINEDVLDELKSKTRFDSIMEKYLPAWLPLRFEVLHISIDDRYNFVFKCRDKFLSQQSTDTLTRRNSILQVTESNALIKLEMDMFSASPTREKWLNFLKECSFPFFNDRRPWRSAGNASVNDTIKFV